MKILFFSHGRGRGHAIPDMTIAADLRRTDPTLDLTFVSYAVGARTIRDAGHPVVDLDLPEHNPFIETLYRCGRTIAAHRPDVVFSHEEFAALAAARVLDIPSVFITDWFAVEDRFQTQCLEVAGEILFLDDPGIYEEPASLRGRIRYVGPVVRTLTASRADRASIREQLDLPQDAFVILVLPGGSALSSEEFSPIYALVRAAVDLLPHSRTRIIWIADAAEQARIRAQSSYRDDVTFMEPHATIDRTMVVADVAITKGTRKTSFELHALGIPSISLSYGLNQIDDFRMPLIPGNTHLRAGELTPDVFAQHLADAARLASTLAPVPAAALAASVQKTTHALLAYVRCCGHAPVDAHATA